MLSSVKHFISVTMTFAILLSSCSSTESSVSTGQTIIVYSALQGGNNVVAQIFAKSAIHAIDVNGNNKALPVMLNKDSWHSEMTWSPDKKWLAFSTAYENAMAGGNSDIFINSWPDQKQTIQITTDPTNDIHPSWSPDGVQLVYQSNGIFTLKVDCFILSQKCITGPVFVTNGSEPVWSPDGEYIAYNGWPDLVNKGKILIARLDDPDAILQISPKDEYCHRPQWSPDGTRVIFDCNKGLYIVNSDGSNLKLIADGGDAKWSPDGTLIAFIGGKSLDAHLGQKVGLGSLDSPPQLSTALFTIQPDGNDLRRITSDDNQSIAQFFWITADMVGAP